jgi:hypothetical protein
MLLPCKFKFGDIVRWYSAYPESKPPYNKDQSFVIRSVSYLQHDVFRPEAYTTNYLCEPIELRGMEHDADVWVAEVNLKELV